ncbi:MAG TPA: hypothetical protein VMP01_06655 [Pirellulaceae bacterium]|nr:hypothetical protein [Pirellulaceae bacterium]
MRYSILFCVATIVGLLGTYVLRANDTFAPPPVQAPAKDYWLACEDYECKLITEQRPIKKTVYECREVPFCLHVLPKFGHCESCPECGCVRFKRVLVKKEVIVGYECVTRCIPHPLGKPGPDKGAQHSPVSAPAADDYYYYRGVDLSGLPQPVIPAPPLPSTPHSQPR